MSIRCFGKKKGEEEGDKEKGEKEDDLNNLKKELEMVRELHTFLLTYRR